MLVEIKILLYWNANDYWQHLQKILFVEDITTKYLRIQNNWSANKIHWYVKIISLWTLHYPFYFLMKPSNFFVQPSVLTFRLYVKRNKKHPFVYPKKNTNIPSNPSGNLTETDSHPRLTIVQICRHVFFIFFIESRAIDVNTYQRHTGPICEWLTTPLKISVGVKLEIQWIARCRCGPL